MGFFSFIGRAVSSIGRAVSKVVKATVRTVCSVSTAITRTISGFAYKVTNGISHLITYVKKAYNWTSNKINSGIEWLNKRVTKAKNWFFNETFIGKSINRAYKYVRDQTWIGKGIKKIFSFAQEKANQFFAENWLGRKIALAAKWVVDSPVGKIIVYASPFVKTASLLFGCSGSLVCKLYQWGNVALQTTRSPGQRLASILINSPLSRTIANHSVSIKIRDFANNFASCARNPINSIMRTEIFQKITNSAFIQKMNSVYQSGKQRFCELYSKTKDVLLKNAGSQFIFDKYKSVKQLFIQAKESPFGLKVRQHTGIVFEKAASFGSFASKVIIQNLPSAIYFGKRFLGKPVQGLLGRIGKLMQPYYNKNLRKPFQNVSRYGYRPVKAFAGWVITLGNYAIIKPLHWALSHSKAYKKGISKIKNFIEVSNLLLVKEVEHLGQKKYCEKAFPILKVQSKAAKSKGLDSSNLLASYSNKIRNKVAEKKEEALHRVFQEIIHDEKQTQYLDYCCDQTKAMDNGGSQFSKSTDSLSLLKHQSSKTCTMMNPQAPVCSQTKPKARIALKPVSELIKQSEVEMHSCVFTAGQQTHGYSIKGQVRLQNHTDRHVGFIFPSGQLFGNNRAYTSQHVVCRELKGVLEPKEKKDILLQGFCADSSLKWPYNDGNYSCSQYILRGFTQQTNQDQSWKLSSGIYR